MVSFGNEERAGRDVPEAAFGSDGEILKDKPEAGRVIRIGQLCGTNACAADEVAGEVARNGRNLRSHLVRVLRATITIDTCISEDQINRHREKLLTFPASVLRSIGLADLYVRQGACNVVD